ncbi:MAG: hypothetical protein M1819_004810 [Sarea resinae]|nr:MAG: hypothetical protein M1819_004810 [Sarea resinae]
MASIPPRTSASQGRRPPPPPQPLSDQEASSTSASPPPQPPPQPQQPDSHLSDNNTSKSPPSYSRSDESQRVYLNDLSSSEAPATPSEGKQKQKQQQQQHQQPSTSTQPRSEDSEPRRCWICLEEETDELGNSSEWRTPCPCVLTAHESCLLDWLSDMEEPSVLSDTTVPKKIFCPQCKSEIVVVRSRSVVERIVRVIEKTTQRLQVPAVLLAIGGGLWAGSLVYGISAIYLVFGEQDGEYILRGYGDPAERTWDSFFFAQRGLHLPIPGPQSMREWNVHLGLSLPLLPVVLIYSRTSIADHLLPMIPVLLWVTQSTTGDITEALRWPPSATTSFAMLPFIKSLYNDVYERLFGQMEREWMKQIRPNARELDGELIGNRNDNRAADDDEAGILVDINVEIVREEDEEQVEEEAAAAENEQAVRRRGAAGDENARPAPAAAAAAPPMRRDDLTIQSLYRTTNSVLGALALPGVSALMGFLLELGLPKSWTSSPPPSLAAAAAAATAAAAGVGGGSSSRRGLLQSRWGRSLVGGCLFVVLKDAITLYCRWKVAQSHRERRVLDYDKRSKRLVRP